MKFRKNLNRSVERGLSETKALAALTTIPAEKMGKGDQLGRIKKGYLANLSILSGNYFNNKSKVVSVWIGGEEYPVIPKYDIDITGEWKVTMGKKWYQLELKNNNNSYSGTITKDTTKLTLSKLKIGGNFISWQVILDSTAGPSRFTGHILENRMEGTAHDMHMSWNALKTGGVEKEEKKQEVESPSNISVYFPEGSYGWEKENRFNSKNILIHNTTVWTCGKKGILEGVDILFENGKVKKIGYGLNSGKGVVKIDGIGKHVTPGLIDCHSHSAAFSINEGSQSITAEVRIQDVINSDDIAIYWELAGGLTMANILHGSANTIGGQNAVIKLRWGVTPEKLLYKNAMPGIKFALGEDRKSVV